MKKCLFFPHYYSLFSLISQRLSPCGQYEYGVPKKKQRRASYDVTPSNIFVIHSKLLISTTLHEHGTESQCDGGEDNRGEECDCDHSSIFLFVSTFVFSHCKDRPHSRTLQVFSSLFGSVIATPPSIWRQVLGAPFIFVASNQFLQLFFARYCTSKRNGASANVGAPFI